MKGVSLKQTISLILLLPLVAGPLLAGQRAEMQRDPLLIALIDYNRAREIAECQPGAAQILLLHARESVGRYVSSHRDVADTADSLTSNIRYLEGETKQTLMRLEDYRADILKQLQRRRFASVLVLIEEQRSSAPSCDPVFSRWEAEARREHESAIRMLNDARSLLESQPDQAKALALTVERRHAEMPEAEAIRARAEAIKRQLSNGRSAFKSFLKATIITTLAASAGYVAYREWEKRRPVPAKVSR